jgi:hypothetical protein
VVVLLCFDAFAPHFRNGETICDLKRQGNQLAALFIPRRLRQVIVAALPPAGLQTNNKVVP